MNRYKKFQIGSIAAVIALGAFFSVPLSAQEGETFTLEEIVVTARKTEESIQDVSLSITAFSAEDLSVRSVESLNDIALFTPGLTFEDYSNGGFATPIIRGGAQFNLDGLEQNVSTFIDGVYIPRQWAIDVGLVDTERLEVVKGPQSALYGANSFLGAINYVTKKPSLEEFSADIGATVGDGGRRDITGSFSIPIVTDVLAIKLNAALSQYDGDFNNSHPLASQAPRLGTDEDFNGFDNETYGVNIVAQPIDIFGFELGYSKFDKFSEVGAQTRLEEGAGDLNCGNTNGNGEFLLFCGELPGTPIEPGSAGGATVEAPLIADPRSYFESETEVFRAAFSIDITDNIFLNYQYGNVDAEVFALGGTDRDPIVGQDPFGTGTFSNFLSPLPTGEFDYDTHELRVEFSGNNGFSAMLGAFLLDGEDSDAFFGVPAPVGGVDPIFREDFTPVFDVIETDTVSVFTRVVVPVSDMFQVSFEGRFTDEEITTGDATGVFPFEDNYFTPRVNFDLNLTDDNLVFLSVARGIKSGGVNAAVVREPPGTFFDPLRPLSDDERFFDPDENITYELGTKNTLLNGRLVANATLFLIDWNDLQVSTATSDPDATLTTANITTNLGAAESRGLEADFTFLATESLTLNAGLALIDATYDDGVISQRIARSSLCDGIVCAVDGNIGGNDLPRSSDTQWNIGAQYDGSIGGTALDYFVRADLTGQSEQFVSEVNLAEIPSRTLLNIRGGISSEDWSAELWVRNATDEEYVSNAFFVALPFGVSYVPTFGPQRRVGVDFKYNF